MQRRIAAALLFTVITLVSTGPLDISAQDATPAAGGGSPAAGCPVVTEEEIAEQVVAYVAAADAEALDRIEPFLHEDFSTNWAIGAEVLDRDQFLTTLGALYDAYEHYSFVAEDIIVSDNVAAVRWTASGTQVAPLAGFQPSDQPATWTGILMVEFQCGQMVEMWSEADHLSRLRQHGHLPVPDEATPAP